jgi:hypothetical protein
VQLLLLTADCPLNIKVTVKRKYCTVVMFKEHISYSFFASHCLCYNNELKCTPHLDDSLCTPHVMICSGECALANVTIYFAISSEGLVFYSQLSAGLYTDNCSYRGIEF